MKSWIEESQPEKAEAAKASSESAPAPASNEELRRKFIEFLAAEDLSVNAAAKLVGYSASVLSQYLSDTGCKYPGDVPRLERKIADALRNAERRRKLGVKLVESEVTRQVAAALEAIRRTNDVGLIVGDAGVGKTSGVLLYCQENPTCIEITLTKWACDQHSVEGRLFNAIGHGDWKGNTKRADYLVERLRGSDRLIIVDNAHKATNAAVEWLFDLHDEARCPIALIGNEQVMAKIETNDQRFSRIGLKQVVQARKPRALVRHLISQVAECDNPDVEALAEQVADNRGRFRAVLKQMSLAQMIREGAPQLSWPEAFRAAHPRLVRNYALA